MESFFYNGGSLNLIDVEELLLYRYKNIEYILELDFKEGILFINKAIEEKRKRKYWEMWLMKYALMDNETFVSFEEFYDTATGRNIDTTSKEDVLAMAAEIQRKAREKRGEIDGT